MKDSLERKIYFWNALGGIISASTSVIVIMVITHTTGTYDAGIFSLGYANAMMFTNIGTLDTRSHQCADAKGVFEFSDYFAFRIITCLFMITCSILFVSLADYSTEKVVVTLLLCLYCAIINISDIFQGNVQILGRLDLGGQSLALRGVVNLFLFAVIYLVSNNLIVSLIIMDISAFLWILSFDKIRLLSLEKPIFLFRWDKFKKLFYESFPLGMCLTLQVGIFNIPKYAIDKYLPVEMQTIYSIIFMLAFVVNLFGLMIYRPILVKISLLWKMGDTKEIYKILLKKVSMLVLLTLIVAIAGYFCGTLFLSVLYGVDVMPYKRELLVLLLGGGFTGVLNLFYFVVTVIKKQYIMLGAYVCVFMISFLISYPMVNKYLLMGAAESYLITSIILNGLLALIVAVNLKKR